MGSSNITINKGKLDSLVGILRGLNIPREIENPPNFVPPKIHSRELANIYLFLVAICHQTSSLGEKRLQGKIAGKTRAGWDYLKEKLFQEIVSQSDLISPTSWESLTPERLSNLYQDREVGLTLNRINERTFLINDLGKRLIVDGFEYIDMAFDKAAKTLQGSGGFLNYLAGFLAYSDPLRKKSYFFLSLVGNECGWKPRDAEAILSPVDYHEVRGHLRIGTAKILDKNLERKIRLGLVITETEDFQLRSCIQEIMGQISSETGLTNSQLHYYFWNVFRNCCPRNPQDTHCTACPSTCGLPHAYRKASLHEDRCTFSDICNSAGKETKVMDPPYIGHYY